VEEKVAVALAGMLIHGSAMTEEWRCRVNVEVMTGSYWEGYVEERA
jgi:hypothetical protein